jgi:cellulose synthase/poly-beta-1,6-N-acetylglucosamine synthase-like glycosyltransferase
VETFFWVMLAATAYAVLGYPVVLSLVVAVAGRRSAIAPPPEPAALPRVSILLAAHNEAAVLQSRLVNLLSLRYPPDLIEILAGSDGSTDVTASVARRFQDRGVRLLESTDRRGKTALLNAMVVDARGDVVVFTDANCRFQEDALQYLVAPFASPRVGRVVGELVYENRDEPWVRTGEGLYWRLENAIKARESRLGGTLVATGAIYAMRRELCRPLPVGVSDDSLNPLLVLADGYEVVVERRARAFEKAATSLSEEFHRKARMVTRQLGAHACVRHFLSPFRPLLALRLASHKLARWLVPLFLLGALLANLTLLDRWLYRATLLAAVVGGLAFVIGLGAIWRGWPVPAPLRLWVYLGVVSAAALKGLADFALGRKRAVWRVSPSTR